jgi:hypothetical protein
MWTRVVDFGVFLRRPDQQVQLGQSNSLKVDMTCCFHTGTKGDSYPQTGRGNSFAVLLNGTKTSDTPAPPILAAVTSVSRYARTYSYEESAKTLW